LRDEGTGLGLYIVRRVIQEHNGTVEAKNRREGGAVFEIKLPGTGDIPNG
jgi:signal transduction histidine kinase